jgi:ABC-type uncharacterized transport system ATPase subunit
MKSSKLDRLKSWANSSHKKGRHIYLHSLNSFLELLNKLRFQIGQLVLDGNVDLARQTAERSLEILESNETSDSITDLTCIHSQTPSSSQPSRIVLNGHSVYKQLYLICGNWPKISNNNDTLLLQYLNETPSEICDIWARRNTVRMQYV